MKISNYIYILLLSVFFVQCTKKTSDAAMNPTSSNQKAWRSAAPTAGPARNVEIGEYSSFDLANGLKVIVVENHKLPVVSYQISLLNDPIVEGEKAGYVSMAGGLLATGTKTMSKADIDNKVDFYGASLNGSSSGLFMRSLKKHSAPLLEVFTDILYNPAFPQEEFDKAITQTLSGLATQKTDPNAIASNVASMVLYGKDHPYGEIQTEKTTKNITVEDCKSYYNTYFKPNNAYLIIVGDITVEEARKNANTYFGKWEAGKLPSHAYPTPSAPSERKVAFAHKDGAVQSVIRITYPVELRPDADDLLAANVMNQILGGGVFSGRLMQNLREDKAYTYGARSSLSADPLIGTFNASASVRNAVTDSSVYEFLYELERMNTEPVAADDLQLVKNSMAGSFARSLESPQTIANFARTLYKYNLPKDYYDTYLSRLEAITPAQVSAAAAKYIKPNNAYVLVVGNKDEVAERLLRFDADGEIDYYGPFGDKIDYDNVAIPEGITAQTVIDDYLSAIGGREKLQSVKTLITKGGMDIMGQSATLTVKIKAPDKYLNAMSMGGMVMQEQKFDGLKASVSGMGQSQVFNPGEPAFEEMKNETRLFEQLYYTADQIELKGIEDMNGEKCYKVVLTDNGSQEVQFYSMKTNLLLATVSSRGEGEQVQTITTNFSDYKDVSGIQMPHTMGIVGAAPFPLEMKITGYEVNAAIDDAEFMVK